NADSGNGAASWNQRRQDAVTALDAWLATNPTGSDDPDILQVGDFNAYAMEDPILDLVALGYENLVADATHSYGFPLALGVAPETQSWGTLDYAFASSTLSTQVTGAAVWHINADEPVYLDYNVEFKPDEVTDSLYDTSAFRSSDHDPIVVGLSLGND
ncbi:MAG: DNA degradation protein EddB, partial [Chloroflexota bacterium]